MTCFICTLDSFPTYVLPCQHIACGLCIVNCTIGNKYVICPYCRAYSRFDFFLKWFLVKLKTCNFNNLQIGYNLDCVKCQLKFKFILALECCHNVCPSCALNSNKGECIGCPICQTESKMKKENVYKNFGFGKQLY